MKSFLLTLCVAFSLSVFGQNNPNTGFPIYVDFDNPTDTTFVTFEISSNSIWQVGIPQKTILNQANGGEKVIITDTINPYPINDTSSFIIKCEVSGGALEGAYSCDTDSLNDYGLIEISIDSGQTWINILEDSLVNQGIPSGLAVKPILTGNSNGWQYFNLHPFFNQLSPQNHGSYWIKYTFISDSIDTGHDGLMFDDMLVGILANTQNLYQLNNLKVFPNPTNNVLNFQFEEQLDNAEIRIYSNIGQLVDTENIQNNEVQFQVADWQRGLYYYGIFVEGKLVKQGQVLVED